MTVLEALNAHLYTGNLDQAGWVHTCATRCHLKSSQGLTQRLHVGGDVCTYSRSIEANRG
jgi:hypothetical protein